MINSTFPLFPRLPPELRVQIWRNALPDIRGFALYFYRKGCWYPRHLLPSEEGYDHERNDQNLHFDFRYDFLDNIQFELPLVFINREARHIAAGWISNYRIEIRTCEDKPSPIFVSSFDPIQDVLYVGLDKWNEFSCEPIDRCFEPIYSDSLFSAA